MKKFVETIHEKCNKKAIYKIKNDIKYCFKKAKLGLFAEILSIKSNMLLILNIIK